MAVHKLIRIQKVVAEAVAELYSDVFHFAFSSAVFFEVILYPNPFLVVTFKVLAVVGEEVLLWCFSVYESEVSTKD